MDIIAQSIGSIREHRWVFCGLLLLQSVLLAVGGYVLVHYTGEVLTDAQALLEPLPEAVEDVEGGVMTESMRTVFHSYLAVKRSLMELGLWMLGLVLFGNGLLWVGTYKLLYEARARQLLRWWLFYALSTIVVIALLGLMSYLWVRPLLQGEEVSSGVPVVIGAGIVLLLYYLWLE